MPIRSRTASPAHLSRLLLPLVALFVVLAPASPATAQNLPCAPCGGLQADDAAQLAAAFEGAPVARATGDDAEGLLLAAWPVELDGSAPDSSDAAARLTARGVTPLVQLVFRTPSPLPENLAALGRELEAAARVVRQAPAGSWIQIDWRPAVAPAPADRAAQWAYFVKNAAVAVTGAGGGRVVSPPLPADRDLLTALYDDEVAAYLDVLAVAAGEPAALADRLAVLTELDPGKPVVVQDVTLPAETPPEAALAAIAERASAGASVVLVAPAGGPTAADAAPLTLLAREFAGDLAFDPYSSPQGPAGARAWSFVRGEDLALRVIARAADGERDGGDMTLVFSDAQLREPERVLLDGEIIPLAGVRRDRDGVRLAVADPGGATLLRLSRPSLAEMVGQGGVAEELSVASERQIPVEEILRRLQAFEDAQGRRLDHWQAVNQTELRLQGGTSTQTFEATLRGPFFFREEGGEVTVADWAWEDFFVNGVRWRGDKIPEVPLVEPEKAATLPLEITFDRTYRYRLKGTGEVGGRPAWVIEFEPVDAAAADSERLFRGTVWVDREIFARLKTQGVQTGLEGEVLSNEEILFYTPIDAAGQPAPWAAESFVMPLRTVSRQVLSVLNNTTLVERETHFTDVTLNGASFDADRAAVESSEVTMVRDTDAGLRYLVPDDETGGRVVKEGFDRDRTFLAAGVFYDESQDFPLPLGGLNYFSFDFKDTGTQVNALFAGVVLTVAASDPDFLGSRWDAGFDAFALAVAGSDVVFRDGEAVDAEEIEVRPASLDLKLGRPFGPYFKLRTQYELDYRGYGRSEETAADFVLPSSHFVQSFNLFGRFSRAGYTADLGGSYNLRSEWEPWGLPGTPGFVADAEPFKDFVLWEASVSKNWYLPGFRKFGIELNYVDGQDLDRFSKYGFGFFGDTRVHGYQSDKVKAERAYLAHLTYGFEVGQVIRIEGVLDVASATDEAAGLDNELLAGVGLVGTFVGPWETLVNLDLGVAVEGPDDGFGAWLVFLKQVEWKWLDRWTD